jgi:hypothetical protein
MRRSRKRRKRYQLHTTIGPQCQKASLMMIYPYYRSAHVRQNVAIFHSAPFKSANLGRALLRVYDPDEEPFLLHLSIRDTSLIFRNEKRSQFKKKASIDAFRDQSFCFVLYLFGMRRLKLSVSFSRLV